MHHGSHGLARDCLYVIGLTSDRHDIVRTLQRKRPFIKTPSSTGTLSVFIISGTEQPPSIFHTNSASRSTARSPCPLDEIRKVFDVPDRSTSEQPPACLFYFFHGPPDVSTYLYATRFRPGPTQTSSPNVPIHNLHTHLDLLQMRAGFSEHVKPIHAFPVAVDPAPAAPAPVARGPKSWADAATVRYWDPRWRTSWSCGF